MCVIRTLEKSAIICLRQYNFAMKILRMFCAVGTQILETL